jgi:hypothetical protein
MTQKGDINQLKKKNNTPSHHFATPKPYLWVKNFKTYWLPCWATLACYSTCSTASKKN